MITIPVVIIIVLDMITVPAVIIFDLDMITVPAAIIIVPDMAMDLVRVPATAGRAAA